MMKRMFEDKETEKKDDAWYGRIYDRRGDVSRDNNRREVKNPMRNGVVSKCVICSSEYHRARQCPQNATNRGRRGGGSGARRDQSHGATDKVEEEAARMFVSNE